MHANLARRMEWLRASDIREMLKVTQRPDMISLAGGLPAPEIFPVRELADAAARIFDESGEIALQYATSEGHLPLREKIAARMNAIYGLSVSYTHLSAPRRSAAPRRRSPAPAGGSRCRATTVGGCR